MKMPQFERRPLAVAIARVFSTPAWVAAQSEPQEQHGNARFKCAGAVHDDCQVTITDVNQSNGVIHVVDKVLLPKLFAHLQQNSAPAFERVVVLLARFSRPLPSGDAEVARRLDHRRRP